MTILHQTITLISQLKSYEWQLLNELANIRNHLFSVFVRLVANSLSLSLAITHCSPYTADSPLPWQSGPGNRNEPGNLSCNRLSNRRSNRSFLNIFLLKFNNSWWFYSIINMILCSFIPKYSSWNMYTFF